MWRSPRRRRWPRDPGVSKTLGSSPRSRWLPLAVSRSPIRKVYRLDHSDALGITPHQHAGYVLVAVWIRDEAPDLHYAGRAGAVHRGAGATRPRGSSGSSATVSGRAGPGISTVWHRFHR